ncbi:ABATE domain-containing protein [Kibdelosporangium philippinense]|uniref:ABATE domain-containing protein n=1 Tax=Kibdelosporangium philippinense TaxID=211113 RepID=A0ABS8ZAH3_9PSEU|nr:CGNR zinc finger domain-containing protein [Kibdelosporangium philippinense]MCE7003805.1 ABATE domain-containing protein [Kibdelosporangium philippinense]
MSALALQLASTIRHDGHGGVADDLATEQGFRQWVRAHVGDLDADREQVVALRRAVRSLFAYAVRPGEPSKADANRLLDPQTALAQVNAAAGAVRPQLDWPEDGEPILRYESGGVLATLARAAIEFLASDDRAKLRACPAPRCVRYFVKDHPQQEWCKPSCGNRARVARYYKRKIESV